MTSWANVHGLGLDVGVGQSVLVKSVGLVVEKPVSTPPRLASTLTIVDYNLNIILNIFGLKTVLKHGNILMYV